MQKKQPKQQKNSGFTLIEVVLVLAIGSAIFLLAFLAFRQVSVNRRDTQRRSDIAKMMAALETNYLSTRSYPNSSNINVAADNVCTDTVSAVANSFLKFLQDHMCEDAKFLSPSGQNYSLYTYGNVTYAKDRIRYRRGVRCDNSSGNTSTYYIKLDLEKGTLCRDSG